MTYLSKSRQLFVWLPEKYPMPDFQIGDIVADEWIDEFGVKQRDVGEIVGMVWHPKKQQWEYAINWLKSTVPSHKYPLFDNYLVMHSPESPLHLLEECAA